MIFMVLLSISWLCSSGYYIYFELKIAITLIKLLISLSTFELLIVLSLFVVMCTTCLTVPPSCPTAYHLCHCPTLLSYWYHLSPVPPTCPTGTTLFREVVLKDRTPGTTHRGYGKVAHSIQYYYTLSVQCTMCYSVFQNCIIPLMNFSLFLGLFFLRNNSFSLC